MASTLIGTIKRTTILDVTILTDLTAEEWKTYYGTEKLTIERVSSPTSWGLIKREDGGVVGEILEAHESAAGSEFEDVQVEDELE